MKVKKVHELNKGDKVDTSLMHFGTNQYEVMTFDGLDGMYGKFINEARESYFIPAYYEIRVYDRNR